MSSNEVRLEKTEIGELLFSVMTERDALRAENERLHEQLGWLRARVWDEQDSDEGIVYRLRIALDRPKKARNVYQT